MQPSERITFASVPEIQRTWDPQDAKGLSITTHLDSSVLWRPSPHAVPLKMSGRKYLHSLIRLDIQTSRRFYQRETQTKTESTSSSPPHPLKLTGAVYNCSDPLIKNRSSCLDLYTADQACGLYVATLLNKYPYTLTSVDYISQSLDRRT